MARKKVSTKQLTELLQFNCEIEPGFIVSLVLVSIVRWSERFIGYPFCFHAGA